MLTSFASTGARPPVLVPSKNINVPLMLTAGKARSNSGGIFEAIVGTENISRSRRNSASSSSSSDSSSTKSSDNIAAILYPSLVAAERASFSLLLEQAPTPAVDAPSVDHHSTEVFVAPIEVAAEAAVTALPGSPAPLMRRGEEVPAPEPASLVSPTAAALGVEDEGANAEAEAVLRDTLEVLPEFDTSAAMERTPVSRGRSGSASDDDGGFDHAVDRTLFSATAMTDFTEASIGSLAMDHTLAPAPPTPTNMKEADSPLSRVSSPGMSPQQHVEGGEEGANADVSTPAPAQAPQSHAAKMGMMTTTVAFAAQLSLADSPAATSSVALTFTPASSIGEGGSVMGSPSSGSSCVFTSPDAEVPAGLMAQPSTVRRPEATPAAAQRSPSFLVRLANTFRATVLRSPGAQSTSTGGSSVGSRTPASSVKGSPEPASPAPSGSGSKKRGSQKKNGSPSRFMRRLASIHIMKGLGSPSAGGGAGGMGSPSILQRVASARNLSSPLAKDAVMKGLVSPSALPMLGLLPTTTAAAAEGAEEGQRVMGEAEAFALGRAAVDAADQAQAAAAATLAAAAAPTEPPARSDVTISATIFRTKLAGAFPKRYTEYVIAVTHGEAPVGEVERRYREFHTLFSNVTSARMASAAPAWERRWADELADFAFPGKVLFGSTRPSVVEERAQRLGAFLRLLSAAAEEVPEVRQALAGFLGVEQD